MTVIPLFRHFFCVENRVESKLLSEVMLGLHRNQLRVVAPDSGWENIFDAERSAIEGAVGEKCLRVEHIGSTAVPNLPAKPIIDIGVLVESADTIGMLRSPLVRMGYIDRGDKGDMGGYLFVKERSADVRTHHIHVIVLGDPAWDRYLRFRDALRRSDQLCAAYAALKRTLQAESGEDRRGYTQGKTAFIENVLSAGS